MEPDRFRRRWTVVAAVVAVAFLARSARGADAAVATGLVAAYGFEENSGLKTADASGHGLTAVLVGAAWTTQGKFGNALTFDGATSRVTLIDDSPLLRLTTAVTLEAWVKPTTVTSAWRDVFEKGRDNYFLMGTSDHTGVPAAGATITGLDKVIFDVTALPVNVWSHLAMTYDGATLRFYVNGIQRASATRNGTMLTSNLPLQIGGDSVFGQSFAGTIDEARVYNRVLTAAEIQADMIAPVVDPSVDSSPPTTPTALTATAFSGTEIRLSWPASTDNVGVTGYRVERCRGAGCGSFAQVAIAVGPSYDDTKLALNTHYTYRVRAADAWNNLSGYSQTAAVLTPTTTTVPGLVAAYAFDEGAGPTTADASGAGNTGLIANATWTAAGRFGGALHFNGTNSWVTINDSPSLHLTTGMTLEAWVNPLSLPPRGCTTQSCAWMDVLVKETDRYYIEATSDLNQQPEAGAILAAGKHIVFAPAVLALNTWSHLAITYDTATIRFYAGGLEVATAAETSPLTVSTAPLRIGGDSIYGQFFNGAIDEVRVYNRALSADEVLGDSTAPIGAGSANPMPAAGAIVPDGAIAGAAGFTLTVQGTGFIPGSIVGWNGADRVTTYVSPTELHADIPASDVASGGLAEVTVYNPPPLGGTSGERPFAICVASLEVCNGMDDDCDGLIDDADPSIAGRPVWYRDVDGDSHGDSSVSQFACVQPVGFVGAGGDCDDANAAVWGVPDEVPSLVFIDAATLSWAAPAAPGGLSPAYDTLRADSPMGFDVAATCVETNGQLATTIDSTIPAEDAAFYYLIRAANACGLGLLGTATDGSERLAPRCP